MTSKLVICACGGIANKSIPTKIYLKFIGVIKNNVGETFASQLC